VLSERTPNRSNHLRAIMYANAGTFESPPFDVKVGATIICFPVEGSDQLEFNAVVDHRIVDSFHFAPRITLFEDEHFDRSRTFEAADYSSRPKIAIDDPGKYTMTNLAFIVRPSDLVDEDVYWTDVESIRAALMTLKQRHARGR